LISISHSSILVNDSQYFLGKSINYRLESDLSEEKRSSGEEGTPRSIAKAKVPRLWDSRRSLPRSRIVFRAINYRKIIRKKNLDPASAIGGDARRPRRKGGGAKASGRRGPPSRWTWLERRGRGVSRPVSGATAGPPEPIILSHNSVVERCGRYAAPCNLRIILSGSAIPRPRPNAKRLVR